MKKYLARLDFDPNTLVPVHGGFSHYEHSSWKNHVVIKFMHHNRNEFNIGDTVVVQFTSDKRKHYSLPKENQEKTDTFQRVSGSFVDNTAERTRTVVRIYKVNNLRSGVNVEELPRLIIAKHDLRHTNMGGRTTGYIQGDVLYIVEGCGNSNTGNHGGCGYVAVVRNAEMIIEKTSNNGKYSKTTHVI